MEIGGPSVIALAIIVFINTLFLAGLAAALWKLNQMVSDLAGKVDPLITRAASTLERVEASTAGVEQRLNQALDGAGQLITKVSDRVDTATAVAEEAVTGPLIGAASLVAGLQRGLETYSSQTRSNSNGSEEK